MTLQLRHSCDGGASPKEESSDRPRRRAVRRFLASFPRVRQQVALFAPLLVRGLGAVLLLLGIAYLGERERQQSMFGQQRLELSAAELVSSRASPLTDAEEVLLPSAELHASSGNHQQNPSAPKAAQADGSAPVVEKDTPPCVGEKKTAEPALTADGKVILNEAGAQELMSLRGVGEKRAEDILALRARLGRFRKVGDLLRIRGIGWKSLAKLREHVVLDRPPPAAEEKPTDDPSSVPEKSLPLGPS